jgi:hypothetical protein
VHQRLHIRHLEIIALLAILVLAAFLRLNEGAHNPGWYADEGTHVFIARSLVAGDVQYMAIGQSTLLFARLPLFEVLLALVYRLGGEGMAGLRALTGLLGVVSVGTLYCCVRLTRSDPILALLAALLLAIYPQAVLYSRFGFSYNLLAPLTLVVYLGLWDYLSVSRPRRGLAWAALAIGLGAVSDLWMLALVAPMVAIILLCRPRDALWAVPLALLPFGLYVGLMLVWAPDPFLFDVGFTLSRLTRLSLWAQLKSLALNYAILIGQDHWMALALVGLFLLPDARLRRLSLLFLLFPIAAIGRTEALVSLSAYYTIPFLPFISLGVAVLLRRGVPYVLDSVLAAVRSLTESRGRNPTPWKRWVTMGCAGLIVFSVIGSPFLTSTIHLANQTRSGFSTAIDPFLIDAEDGRAAAEYLNARTRAGDVVIASPGLGWLFDADVADPQMAVAFSGRAMPHLPADIPPERYVFNPDYRRARFIAVDNYWTNWAVHNVAGVADMMVALEDWALVFESGEIRIFANPQL